AQRERSLLSHRSAMASAQLAVLASAPVVAAERRFLAVAFGLAVHAQSHTRHGLAPRFRNGRVAFFAMAQAGTLRLLAARTRHRVGDRRVDLVLDRIIVDKTLGHANNVRSASRPCNPACAPIQAATVACACTQLRPRALAAYIATSAAATSASGDVPASRGHAAPTPMLTVTQSPAGESGCGKASSSTRPRKASATRIASAMPQRGSRITISSPP